ncbi:MAG TPA: HAD-IC family P-type ATPase, partial [Polyangiaceae bacterium]|nr:HAD-IC family P-type ATPase [Polyangiaceae bacterium]
MPNARSLSDRTGLSSRQAGEALSRFGPNALPPPPSRSLLARVSSQLKSALIYLLLFALAIDVAAWMISGAGGVPFDALAILVVVFLNAGLGILQEYRSEQALQELQRMSAPRAWTLRDGAFEQLDAARIVPGDLVRIEAGDRIAADGVAVGAEGLSLDEAVLTGESLPIEKSDGDELLSGTLVAHGRALLRVSRTGTHSSLGKLASSIGAIDTTRTPLEKRVDELGRQITKGVALICVALTAAGLLVDGLANLGRIAMFAVALGVAIVPEGMPAMMTMALSFGVQRIARRHAIVRRLAAVEGLGAITVIATDKTGTLTENRLAVDSVDLEPGRENDALCAMVLANDLDVASGAGDPLEGALIAYARARGTDAAALQRAHPRLSSRGFDSHWRCMRVTVVSPGGKQVAFLKGAPESIVARCQLGDDERRRILNRVEQLAGQGLKVLGLARGRALAETDLTFLGLVGLGDPPRPEARAAVSAARRAGVRVLMVTGDHAATAQAIAESVGIDAGKVVEAGELGSTPEADDALIAGCNVFARMQPEHKLRLIERLQAKGEVVAMTGDGLNDAPALKRADIGVAMGQRGSEVAREVSDVVLLDDNFATIVSAVEEGRRIYANVQSFVRFSFSSNVALLLVVLGSALGSLFLGLRSADGSLLLPFTALQILWINFLGDGPPALAIALDRTRDALLDAPRDARAPLLDRTAARFVAADGVLKAGVGLALLVGLPRLGATTSATATAVFLYEGVAKLLSMFPARRLA